MTMMDTTQCTVNHWVSADIYLTISLVCQHRLDSSHTSSQTGVDGKCQEP